MEFLKEMAKVLIVDEIARRQEDTDSENETALHDIEPLTFSQEDICDTVPDGLAAQGISLDGAINSLLPEMARLVSEIDKRWNGSLTMAELAQEFGDGVYVTVALTGIGHGVALDDDAGIDRFLQERGCEVIHSWDVSISEMEIYDAVDSIEFKLTEAMAEREL
jgi:hypothetical protein